MLNETRLLIANSLFLDIKLVSKTTVAEKLIVPIYFVSGCWTTYQNLFFLPLDLETSVDLHVTVRNKMK